MAGIGKAEWTDEGTAARFVITILSAGEWPARTLWEELYCARGDMENRIKEKILDLLSDRTSTGYHRANQLHLWFSNLTYLLIPSSDRPLSNPTVPCPRGLYVGFSPPERTSSVAQQPLCLHSITST